MSSVREQLVVAAVAALNAGVPPCAFERTRSVALVDADLPRGVVYPVRDPKENPFLEGLVTRSRLTLLVELRALGSAVARPDQAVDPLYVWAVSKLVGNKFGGLALKTTEGDNTFQYDQGDRPLCLLTVEFLVEYQYLAANVELVK